jgi:hypothetical protein
MKHFSVLLFLLIVNFINAQSIDKTTFSSSGKLITNASNQLNFTVGEPIIGSISNASNELEQGFWNAATKITLSENSFLLDKLDVTVYPNPVQNILKITFETAVSQDYQLRLFDMTGKLLKTQKIQSGNIENQIKMSDLSKGAYLLNITQINSNKTIIYKLIKK